MTAEEALSHPYVAQVSILCLCVYRIYLYIHIDVHMRVHTHMRTFACMNIREYTTMYLYVRTHALYICVYG